MVHCGAGRNLLGARLPPSAYQIVTYIRPKLYHTKAKVGREIDERRTLSGDEVINGIDVVCRFFFTSHRDGHIPSTYLRRTVPVLPDIALRAVISFVWEEGPPSPHSEGYHRLGPKLGAFDPAIRGRRLIFVSEF